MTGYRPVIFTILPPFLEQRVLVVVGDGVVAAVAVPKASYPEIPII